MGFRYPDSSSACQVLKDGCRSAATPKGKRFPSPAQTPLPDIPVCCFYPTLKYQMFLCIYYNKGFIQLDPEFESFLPKCSFRNVNDRTVEPNERSTELL